MSVPGGGDIITPCRPKPGFPVDWEGTEPTVDRWREVEKGMEGADNFFFLISPAADGRELIRIGYANGLQAV